MKGDFHQNCNRSVCDGLAEFYNYSTEKYYCENCAETINRYNRKEALELYGHDLCINIEPLKLMVNNLYPSFKALEELETKSEEHFSIFCHSIFDSGGISMSVRNFFTLWSEQSEQHKYFKNHFKITHPDEMSSVITKAIWRKHHDLL